MRALPEPRRRRRAIAGFVALGGALTLAGAAGPPAGAPPPTAAGPPVARLVSSVDAGTALLRSPAASGSTWHGGPTTAFTGEQLTVYVSDAYGPEQQSVQQWADFFGGLVHGSELSLLTAYVGTPADVADACGLHAAGCYGGDQLLVSAEQIGSATPALAARHEYGHHVALHRANTPWAAVDWGTKRWASAENVCTRAAAGAVFPGDEDEHYPLNPGEGFAEAYRVLNEARDGAAGFAWPIVDMSFFPDDDAQRELERDVLDPWVERRPQSTRGRFAPNRRPWTLVVPTPLDGVVRATLAMPAGAAYDLALLGPDGGVLARGLWSGQRSKTLSAVVCGPRSLRVRVTRHGGAGPFTVAVATP